MLTIGNFLARGEIPRTALSKTQDMSDDESISPRTSVAASTAASESSVPEENEKLLVGNEADLRGIDACERRSSNTTRRLSAANVQFVLWTCVNTLATIAIVRCLHEVVQH